MTRINTNVASLVAQNRLQSSNKDLQTSLTRLSTGLRINSGSDDAAGLIASEALRSEITSLTKAVSNTRRASQIIATADSALGQVSNLLNDIRGLVVEASNAGALSPDEIAANQLQVDSSLEAINRISQTTTFQGRKLLDGSLDFITSPGANSASLKNLTINSASLGPAGKVDVEIDVTAAATQAALSINNFAELPGGERATGSITIDSTLTPEVAATSSELTVGTGGTGSFRVVSTAADVLDGNGYTVNVSTVAAGTASTMTVTGTVIDIVLEEGTTLASNAALTDGDFELEILTAGTVAAGATATSTTSGAAEATVGSSTISVTAVDPGTNFNGAITINKVAGTAAPTAVFNAGAIEITIGDTETVSVNALRAAIDGLAEVNATVSGNLSTFSADDDNYVEAISDMDGGTDDPFYGVGQDVVFNLVGSRGSDVFNVKAGTSMDQLVAQINLVSDATGITATNGGTALELSSVDYGSRSVVEVRVISEAAGGNFGDGGRAEGTDIQALVNGRAANGNGNRLNLSTSTLNLQADMEANFVGTSTFTITGGGANFQLGPDVVTNQQARMGIGSVNTAQLGGAFGRLFELGSGEAADLASDPNRAAQIVTEAIAQVTGLRGRLGAFQATSLDSNLVSLNDTLANLQEAESSIRDADFAAESAAMTRAQILVQSGTSVLAMANQSPQNVLSLLR